MNPDLTRVEQMVAAAVHDDLPLIDAALYLRAFGIPADLTVLADAMELTRALQGLQEGDAGPVPLPRGRADRHGQHARPRHRPLRRRSPGLPRVAAAGIGRGVMRLARFLTRGWRNRYDLKCPHGTFIPAHYRLGRSARFSCDACGFEVRTAWVRDPYRGKP